jgi:hypothetical protein
MGRLLQRAGNGTSLPYMFGPGNHEVRSRLGTRSTPAPLKICGIL